MKVWRALAQACGFEPGAGMVKQLSPRELDPRIASELEKEREKRDGVAPERLRESAITALSSHFDGDIDFTRDLIESIEAASGPLTKSVAGVLAGAFKPRDQAA